MAIDTPCGNLSLMIKSRAQQIDLKPNIWIALKMLYILVNSETLANIFFPFIMFAGLCSLSLTVVNCMFHSSYPDYPVILFYSMLKKNARVNFIVFAVVLLKVNSCIVISTNKFYPTFIIVSLHT